MSARKVQLKDNSGNKAYPVTSSACVGMSDGSGSLDKKIAGIISNSGYVACTTAANTVAKTVTQANFSLSTNCRLIVKMTNYNTAASPTLNVNNTGAKPLYYNGEIASADNTWEAGEVLDVYYDGTNYRASNVQGGSGKAEKVTFNNIGSGLEAEDVQAAIEELAVKGNEQVASTNYLVCSTGAGTAAKTISNPGFVLTTGCRLIVKMNNANTAATATLNVNNTGAKSLYYNEEAVSSGNSWDSGEVLDVYYDGTNYRASNMKGSSGGNVILTWNTDVATTRKGVKQNKRKAGLIISYNHPDNGWINEQYVGTLFTDTNWANDANWEKITKKTEDFLTNKIDSLNNSLEASKQDRLTAGKHIIIDPETNIISSDAADVVQEKGTGVSLVMSQKAVSEELDALNERVTAQKSEVDAAKDMAIEAISEEKQEAISDFSSQRVTPEMLSETTLQLINSSGGGTINNAADDEDLYSTGGDTSVIKFKDKAYNPTLFSGLATHILRKNIAGSKNVLTQEMVKEANTIYEVRYDYDLNGATIVMPANCVLKFNGGSLSNGTIIGSNTSIQAEKVRIFKNITFESEEDELQYKSTFNLNVIPPEWFGAVAGHTLGRGMNETATWIVHGNGTNDLDYIPDSSDAINSALVLSRLSGGKAWLTGLIYRIDKTVVIGTCATLHIGNNSAIAAIMNGTGIMQGEDERRYALKYDEYFPTSSMAIAINMDGYSARIEGHGQLLLQGSTYTIGVYIPGRYYSSTDMTTNPYVDIRVISGLRNQTAPDPEDTMGYGTPTEETVGDYYFDKTNRIVYRKVKDAWQQWKNAWCFYNTSLRIDVTQSGSDYRIVNADINIWDIFGFRGIEIIQSGSCWCNDCIWHGTVSNKCSNYVSVFGTNIAQHDMTAMNYQCGTENNKNSMICYCEAHGIQLGRVWDIDADAIRYVMTETSYNNTAQWVSSHKNVLDYGTNNKIFNYIYDPNSIQNVCASQYYNLWENKTPMYTRNGAGFGMNVFNEYKADPNDYVIDIWSKNKYEIGMFNDDPASYTTVVDTNAGIYASAIPVLWDGGLNPINHTNHLVIFIDYAINDLENEDNSFKMWITYGNNVSETIELKPAKSNMGKRRMRVRKVIGNLFNNTYIKLQSTHIFFYALSDAPNQSLKIFRLKVLLDGQAIGTSYVNSDKYGLYNMKPDASQPGSTYFCTDYFDFLVNKGDKDTVVYESVNAKMSVKHDDTELIVSNLIPNVWHIWGTIDKLQVNSLRNLSEKSIDEYNIQFTASGNFTTLRLPSSVKWLGESTIEKGNTYQIHIVNGFAHKVG